MRMLRQRPAPETIKMSQGTTILFLLAVTVLGQALTPSTHFTQEDRQRLRAIFAGAQPYGSDLESVYYSVLGYTLLEEPVPEAGKACDAAKKHIDGKNVDSLFYASVVAAILNSQVKCQVSVEGSQAVLEAALREDSSSFTIYHAVAAMRNLGHKIDPKQVTVAIDSALKADDTPLSHGYAFFATSLLSGDLQKYHDLIEDVVALADEVDDKYLQFDGGLHTTAIFLDGAYHLAGAINKAPSFTDAPEKIVKFANYFLSRKHVQSLRNSVALLSAVKTLATNKFHVPIAVTLTSQVSVSEQQPLIQVRVSNLLGASFGKVVVTADTARHLGTDAVVLSKKPFTVSPNEDSLFELEFMKIKPAHGFYKLMVSITPQKPDQRLIGTTGAEVQVKVTTQVTIENVEIGLADKEQSTAARTTKLQYPSKAANVLEADHHQRIVLRFQLRDKATSDVMVAHQAFLRLTNLQTKQEIFFIPDTDASQTYKFDLDIGDRAGDFNYLSGKYSLDLIIGDAVIQNPFFWTVADANLVFPEAPETGPSTGDRYSKKPEIKHQFREPETLPPTAISTLFTGLVLAPLAILLIMWLQLGANVSNFSLSLSAMGFHLGLGAIFCLYYFYWVSLTMFTTLRYLALIGLPTFFFGNRLLSSIAAKRK